MKVVFMGTPDFSVPVLKGLMESEEHEVTAVVTQPDKARGRSGRLVYTPVKEVAVEAGIPVYTPQRVRSQEFIEQLKTIPCDVIVVIAFGQILPKEVLEYPRYGCINVHASLLPRWRGAAPMQWAILSGDIAEDETGESLHDKLAALGSDLLLRTLDAAEKGQLKPEKQQDDESTYAGMLSKEMGRIDWEKSAVEIERMIRGLNSWPSAFSGRQGKTMKFWKASVCPENTDKKPGTIVKVGKNTFMIQTGDGCLEALEVQLEGKERMDAGSFLRGVHLEEGECLCI